MAIWLCKCFESVSIAKAIPSLLEQNQVASNLHQSCRFNRESDSVTVGAGRDHIVARGQRNVSIAKAIPSLLERNSLPAGSSRFSGFNRESDSVTVGAPGSYGTTNSFGVSIAKANPSLLERGLCRGHHIHPGRFQSRKRFRHCWSPRDRSYSLSLSRVSIAKAIPSLLERDSVGGGDVRGLVSIAKAIPSLLEQ